MKLNNEGINLILKWEGGYKLEAYKCPAGIYTIGAGCTFYADGTKVKKGDTIKQEDAVDLFLDILSDFEKDVRHEIKVDLTDNQFSALVSFTYNVGIGQFKRSTLLKKINKEDFKGAANEFQKWVFVKGEKSNGLMNRRNAEKELFMKWGSFC